MSLSQHMLKIVGGGCAQQSKMRARLACSKRVHSSGHLVLESALGIRLCHQPAEIRADIKCHTNNNGEADNNSCAHWSEILSANCQTTTSRVFCLMPRPTRKNTPCTPYFFHNSAASLRVFAEIQLLLVSADRVLAALDRSKVWNAGQSRHSSR